MDISNYKAVITGDIIGFTEHDSKNKQEILNHLQSILSDFNQDDIRLEIYRGDSIQGIVSVKDALLYLLKIKAAVRSIELSDKQKVDIRLSLGIGQIDFIGKSLGQSDGEAFHISGRNLNKMKSYQTIQIASPDEKFNQEWFVMSALAEEIIQDWTVASSKVVSRLLLDETEKTISGILGISQPAVNKHKKQAGWYAIKKMIHYYNSKF